MDLKGAPLYGSSGGGFTAIYGPDGSEISKSTLGDHDEVLEIAESNMDEITRNKHFLDTCAHYSSSDLLWLGVDTREKKHVRSE
jgi:nitrilase